MVGGANVRNVNAGEGREAAGAKKGGQACNRKHCAHAEYRGLCWCVPSGLVVVAGRSDRAK